MALPLQLSVHKLQWEVAQQTMAYHLLQDLLTRHKGLVASFLSQNYDEVMISVLGYQSSPTMLLYMRSQQCSSCCLTLLTHCLARPCSSSVPTPSCCSQKIMSHGGSPLRCVLEGDKDCMCSQHHGHLLATQLWPLMSLTEGFLV